MKKIIALSFLIFSNMSYAQEMVENQYEIIFDNKKNEQSGSNVESIHTKYDASSYTNVPPATTKENTFKECIFVSDKLISKLEKLKAVPDKEKISILYKSNYWKTLTDEDRNKTLAILARLTGVTDNQYVIIKGQIAESFKTECLALMKK
jgi:hypothetical protein